MNSLVAIAALAASAAAQPLQSIIEAPGPHGPLQAAMLAPQGTRGPVALIIPGSGPTDRDGNNPLGVRASSYRLLAEALAQRGITSVRTDKRGMFGSRAAIPDANAVSLAEYAGDVRTWVETVRARTGAHCVWLIGHSEGGLVALIASRDAPGVCGLVLVAAPGRRVGEALREQLRSNVNFAPMLEQALAGLARLEAGQSVDTANMPPQLMQLFAPPVQRYLMDLLRQDPAALLAPYPRPVLIVQGQRDLQVSEADARRLAAANPRARLVLLPTVNHVLKEVGSDDRAANLATYANPNLPLAGGVADAIAAFIAPEPSRD